MIIGSKNKGDWSELYVLLYLLGTGHLYAADEQLNRIGKFYFPIKKIMRNDIPTERVDFVLDNVNKVEIYLNDELEKKITSHEFTEEASVLYHDILTARGRSFDIPHAEKFLNNIYLNRLATPSNDVVDIKMEMHDTITGIDQVMGFSIKSYIGGAPTLLNASGATNFMYRVNGINDAQMNQINAINTPKKIIERIRAISRYGGTIKYFKPVNDVFYDNLIKIDSQMDKILAEVLRYSYENNVLDCMSIIEHLETEDPMAYHVRDIYKLKFKRFLCAKALGMDPSKEWSGEDEANGGYIVAKSDGDVLAYHIYNRDKFKKYLFENTKLERGSTTRHEYASIYYDSGGMFINLNLQIRFK